LQVKELGQQKVDASPYLTELMRLEEQAKQQGLGKWSKVGQLVQCLMLHHHTSATSVDIYDNLLYLDFKLASILRI